MKRLLFGASLLLCAPTAALAQGAPPEAAAPAPEAAALPAPTPPAGPAPESPSPILLVPAAPAPAAASAVAPADSTTAARKPGLRFAMGPRVAYVRTAGFDMYSKNDVLAQWSLDATMTLLEARKVSLAVGLAYDGGARSATTRSIETSLAVHRLSVPIEGRYHLVPWAYLFARVAPGAALGLVRVNEAAAPSSLKGTLGFASADLSAGASFLFGPHHDRSRRMVRIWATPELGYGVTSRPTVQVKPSGRDPEDVLGVDAQTNLGALALSGFFWRLSLAATF